MLVCTRNKMGSCVETELCGEDKEYRKGVHWLETLRLRRVKILEAGYNVSLAACFAIYIVLRVVNRAWKLSCARMRRQ